MPRTERHRRLRDASYARGPVGFLEVAAVVGLGLAGLYIRVRGLGDESAWGDEIFTLRHLDAPNLVEFLRRAHGESPVPPLYMILEYGWSRVFGTSVPAIRSLSVVLGMVGLAALYGLTRMLAGWRAAVVATVWATFTFWHVYHSQEIRFYGLTTTLALFAVIGFVKFVETRSTAWLAVNAVFSLAMIWSHPHAGLLFAAQGLFLAFLRRHDWRLAGAWIATHLAVSGTLLGFYLAIDSERAMAITGWVPEPTLWTGNPSLLRVLYEFGGVRPLDATNPLGEALAPLRGPIGTVFVLSQAALAFGGWRLLRRGGAAETTQRTILPTRDTAALLLLWLVVPPILLYALSHLWRPMMLSRYLFFAAFPLYMFIGVWLGAPPARFARTAVLLPIAFFLIFAYPGPIRTPFGSAADFIATHTDATVTIYLADMFSSIPFEFYLADRQPTFVTIVEADWMEAIVSGTTPPDDGYPWIALITPGRMRYWERRLQTAAVGHEIRRFESGRTLMVIRLTEKQP